jgi:hypothetical protein
LFRFSAGFPLINWPNSVLLLNEYGKSFASVSKKKYILFPIDSLHDVWDTYTLFFSKFFETQNKMILGFKKQGVYSRRRMNHGGNANRLLRSYALHAENNFMDAKKIWKKSDMSMFVLFDCLQSFMNKTQIFATCTKNIT